VPDGQSSVKKVTENDVVADLASLFEAAQSSEMAGAVSPHYGYPADWKWRFGVPAGQP
jgi:hypothetical protein